MERGRKQWQAQLAGLAFAFLLFAPALVQCAGAEADGEKDGLASPGKTVPPVPPGWTGDSGSAQGSSPDGSSWKYEWGWAAGPGGKGSGFGYGYGGSGDAGGGGEGGGSGRGGGGGSGRTFGPGDRGYGGHPGGYGGNGAGRYNGEAGGEEAFGGEDGGAGWNKRGGFPAGSTEKKQDGGGKN